MRRLDFKYIGHWTDNGARVLDLGCENGELLDYLRHRCNTNGIGVDINNEQLMSCIKRGLKVVHSDIQENLSLFSDQSFDFVILSQTLQTINQSPEQILSEMLRVGKVAIVSFPNFAYWHFRWQLLVGRTPIGTQLQYDWYDTPNVRYCTIIDFEQWCQKQGYKINACVYLNDEGPVRFYPNVRANIALYRIQKK